LVRLAKEEYKKKLTSQLTDNTIPPGKWWRIAKSVCKQSIPPLKPVIKKYGQVFTGLIFSVGRSGSSSICENF
jgi:hypothetical protein